MDWMTPTHTGEGDFPQRTESNANLQKHPHRPTQKSFTSSLDIP